MFQDMDEVMRGVIYKLSKYGKERAHLAKGVYRDVQGEWSEDEDRLLVEITQAQPLWSYKEIAMLLREELDALEPNTAGHARYKREVYQNAYRSPTECARRLKMLMSSPVERDGKTLSPQSYFSNSLDHKLRRMRLKIARDPALHQIAADKQTTLCEKCQGMHLARLHASKLFRRVCSLDTRPAAILVKRFPVLGGTMGITSIRYLETTAGHCCCCSMIYNHIRDPRLVQTRPSEDQPLAIRFKGSVIQFLFIERLNGEAVTSTALRLVRSKF